MCSASLCCSPPGSARTSRRGALRFHSLWPWGAAVPTRHFLFAGRAHGGKPVSKRNLAAGVLDRIRGDLSAQRVAFPQPLAVGAALPTRHFLFAGRAPCMGSPFLGASLVGVIRLWVLAGCGSRTPL